MWPSNNSQQHGVACTAGLAGFVLMLLLAAGSSPAADSARQYLKKGDDWFASADARRVTDNVLSWQADAGGWPKNTSTTAEVFTGDRATLKGTFDNGATIDELRFLARAFQATHNDALKPPFLRAFDHILAAQYPTGGWPQFHPPGKQYHRHITFNDDAMVRLMTFLREGATDPHYAGLVDAERKAKALSAFDRGVACILKCQITVDGKLTAWCAQHDELNYAPRPARAFELVSISGAESVGIVRLLMSLEHPSPEIIRSVDAAVAWFESAKLAGIRIESRNDPQGPGGKNKVVIKDDSAPVCWARFYEISSNKPLFSDRDSVKKYGLAEISYERRNGYAWYGSWPVALIDREYPAWKKKLATR